MSEFAGPFAVLRNCLDRDDITVLCEACKSRLDRDGIPCFAVIDLQHTPTYLKIKRALEAEVGDILNYLNDFYIYTDETFKTNWHMDTELFTFESAINAWILLSPDRVVDPLGFIAGINDDAQRYYHSVAIKGDECTFRNFRNGKSQVHSLQEIEARQTHTPEINVGDILLINPKMYHKTNVATPKHAFALKFVYGSRKGCLSATQVPSMLWPEVKTFNEIVKASNSWEDVVDGLRLQLKTKDGREKLSSGFYPDKFDLYRKMVQTL